MSKKAQSQWDFGELFPTAPTRRVLTVSELTTTVRRLIEKEIGDVWVTGEVTNLRAQSSGHVYFTLKDGGAQLGCVLFRNEPVGNREFLQDGQKLLLQGGLTVYEPRGQYQLIVHAVEPQGIGALQLAFEKLKRKLQAEGLFAQERKRPLPRYPRRIGLVTSPTGAAIRDVLHVIERRQPSLEIVLAPCRVQGDGAAAEIAAAVRLLNSWSASNAEQERAEMERRPPARRDGAENPTRAGSETGAPPAHSRQLDLILVTRGGGSLEDLWAFNEEIVARAIFDSALPVVSAVGHEIDFTISDFVADLRAATPSAAAEIITEGPFASRQFLVEAARCLRQMARHHLERDRTQLQQLAQRLVRVHPRRELQELLQHLDELHASMIRAARQGWREHATTWSNLQQRLHRLKPSAIVTQRRQALHDWDRRLRDRVRLERQRHRTALTGLDARLKLLGPDNVLARGYSITTDATTGQVVRAAGEVRPGQRLKTKLKSGQIKSIVEGPTG
jgi:exodeoxyribonuclease VII large subunit